MGFVALKKLMGRRRRRRRRRRKRWKGKEEANTSRDLCRVDEVCEEEGRCRKDCVTYLGGRDTPKDLSRNKKTLSLRVRGCMLMDVAVSVNVSPKP